MTVIQVSSDMLEHLFDFLLTLAAHHAVPSPDGSLIAISQGSSLNIYTHIGSVLQSIPLPANTVAKCRFIRWSRLCQKEPWLNGERLEGQPNWQCNRILIADDDSVRVYDINDPRWSATVERASGNFGRIAEVSFGHSANELLVFSDFGIKLVIWSLVTSRGVEIRDPKYMAKCYAYRPNTGHMAIMTRPAAQDTLMLHNPGTHSLIKSLEIPTIDAQEVAWSPDGRWLVVRDAASSGHKLLIYTADGHLFRTYLGVETGDDVGLGIKTFEWDSLSGSLAVGDHNDIVTILSRNTVI